MNVTSLHTQSGRRDLISRRMHEINDLMINASRTYPYEFIEFGSIAPGVYRLTSCFQKNLFRHIVFLHITASEIYLR